jgi:hypothetical protein
VVSVSQAPHNTKSDTVTTRLIKGETALSQNLKPVFSLGYAHLTSCTQKIVLRPSMACFYPRNFTPAPRIRSAGAWTVHGQYRPSDLIRDANVSYLNDPVYRAQAKYTSNEPSSMLGSNHLRFSQRPEMKQGRQEEWAKSVKHYPFLKRRHTVVAKRQPGSRLVNTTLSRRTLTFTWPDTNAGRTSPLQATFKVLFLC